MCANFENYFILHSLRLQLCRLVIYADQPVATKQGKLLFTKKVTSQSLVTDEDPLIGNVLRMTVTVHRQLDLFKVLGVDTIFELGMLSVEPTHTGRGMQTCLIAGYRRNYVPLLTACYLF